MVTPLVKSVRLPTTLEEKPCTPLTIDAAKAEPGRDGMEMLCPPDPLLVGMDTGCAPPPVAMGRP